MGVRCTGGVFRVLGVLALCAGVAAGSGVAAAAAPEATAKTTSPQPEGGDTGGKPGRPGGAPPRLPATGQTITRAAGDDGSIRAGAPMSYTDNGDGTITDRVTGLMWEKKVKFDVTPDAGNLHDADNCYPWRGSCAGKEADCGTDADCGEHGPCVTSDCQTAMPDGMTIFEWVAKLNAAKFAGYSDWRIPNVKELQSIADYNGGKPSIPPAFNGDKCGAACTSMADPACACTRVDNYWTSTSLAPDHDAAWVVHFGNGAVFFNIRTKVTQVRAVRGGLPQ